MHFLKHTDDETGLGTFQRCSMGPSLCSSLTMVMKSQSDEMGPQESLRTNVCFFPRECSRIFGEDGLTLKLFLKRTAPFSILWTLTNYLYLLALKKLTATDVSALFCCNKAFVFLLSWIVLKDRFMGVRVMAHSIPCAVPPCFLRLTTAVSWSFFNTFPH